LKTRAEALDKARATISDLQSKYGLALQGPNGESLYEEAVALKLPRTVLLPPKTVIPCAAEIKDIGKVDPCLIVQSSLPLELLPMHKTIMVGGQVNAIKRSFFAMSSYITDEAWRAQGYWNGQPLPMLVSIRGAYKYLVKQKSYFFKCENYVGADIDQLSPMQPDERDLKLNRYKWGSDLSDELTLIVADF
jgi:hypothetical protein